MIIIFLNTDVKWLVQKKHVIYGKIIKQSSATTPKNKAFQNTSVQ